MRKSYDCRVSRVSPNNELVEQQGEDYQWYTHRIPQTDNPVTKRKNISLFTRSNQVTDQRTGNTRQSIDNDGKQGRNASYNILTANSVSPKRSIAKKNRNQMATLIKN